MRLLSRRTRRRILRQTLGVVNFCAKVSRWSELGIKLSHNQATPAEAREFVELETLFGPLVRVPLSHPLIAIAVFFRVRRRARRLAAQP
jgi:hypothetical protein